MRKRIDSARVVASTAADYYSCLTAAVCALKGPLHGGANEQVFAMLEEIKGSHLDPITYVKQRLAAGKKVMGFGHRIYKDGDPRAKILQRLARKLAQKTGNESYYDLQVTLADYLLKTKGLHPNVDYYTALIYHCLGLEKDLFTVIFAACRTAGWLAHIMEQKRTGRLIRPSSEYIGPKGRKYAKDHYQIGSEF